MFLQQILYLRLSLVSGGPEEEPTAGLGVVPPEVAGPEHSPSVGPRLVDLSLTGPSATETERRRPVNMSSWRLRRRDDERTLVPGVCPALFPRQPAELWGVRPVHVTTLIVFIDFVTKTATGISL